MDLKLAPDQFFIGEEEEICTVQQLTPDTTHPNIVYGKVPGSVCLWIFSLETKKDLMNIEGGLISISWQKDVEYRQEEISQYLKTRSQHMQKKISKCLNGHSADE